MKKIYTCFACGFPIAFEETEVPAHCPGCGAPRSQFLEEPWCGSIEKGEFMSIRRRWIQTEILLTFHFIRQRILLR